MLIDLHCHTLPHSTCSVLNLDKLIDLARAGGLDGICLTEHDRWWDAAELAEARARSGFAIFSGVELTTEMGHVLGFGLPPPGSSLALAGEAHRWATSNGGLLYLAHPARDGALRVDHRTVEYFVSVEAINGSDSRLQNVAATGLAHGFGLPGIGGSDCHAPGEVARAATRFHAIVRDDAELVAALRAGAYEAVYLE
ncbi:MAG: PHP-associated domain-containing protein [Dehalococcoidia bacterium]